MCAVVSGAAEEDGRKGKQAERIKRLIEQLGDEEFDKREAAHKQLAKIGAPAAYAVYKAAKNHPDLEVRHRAGKLLGPVFAPIVARLIEQLGDETFDKREAAQKELVAIGAVALPALRKASAGARDLEIRHRAKKAIAMITTKGK
jgi:HEAT repeat protein